VQYIAKDESYNKLAPPAYSFTRLISSSYAAIYSVDASTGQVTDAQSVNPR
jgi:hypothetical protein